MATDEHNRKKDDPDKRRLRNSIWFLTVVTVIMAGTLFAFRNTSNMLNNSPRPSPARYEPGGSAGSPEETPLPSPSPGPRYLDSTLPNHLLLRRQADGVREAVDSSDWPLAAKRVRELNDVWADFKKARNGSGTLLRTDDLDSSIPRLKDAINAKDRTRAQREAGIVRTQIDRRS